MQAAANPRAADVSVTKKWHVLFKTARLACDFRQMLEGGADVLHDVADNVG
jgi:hypothetical protein